MTQTPEDIARAVSTHDFQRAIPHFAETLVWRAIGAGVTSGRADVTRQCTDLAAELDGVTVELRHLRVIGGAESVVVESLTAYTGDDGEISTVASCDVYDFADGVLTGITSYNVEVPPDSVR